MVRWITKLEMVTNTAQCVGYRLYTPYVVLGLSSKCRCECVRLFFATGVIKSNSCGEMYSWTVWKFFWSQVTWFVIDSTCSCWIRYRRNFLLNCSTRVNETITVGRYNLAKGVFLRRDWLHDCRFIAKRNSFCAGY